MEEGVGGGGILALVECFLFCFTQYLCRIFFLFAGAWLFSLRDCMLFFLALLLLLLLFSSPLPALHQFSTGPSPQRKQRLWSSSKSSRELWTTDTPKQDYLGAYESTTFARRRVRLHDMPTAHAYLGTCAASRQSRRCWFDRFASVWPEIAGRDIHFSKFSSRHFRCFCQIIQASQ